jgi:uncharacterized protein (TIGR03067 family)
MQLCVVMLCFDAAAWPLAAGGDTKKETIKKELEKLEGVWTLVSREAKAQETPKDDLGQFQLTIKSDRWTLSHPQGSDKATMKIDPTKEPKTIDLAFSSLGAMGTSLKLPAGRKIVSRGIYKLEYKQGEGEILTLCRVDEPRLARPKEFKTTDTTGILFVFKRKK